MENSVSNIAVISFPRTASKALTKWYSDKLNKIPAYGVLHKPEYLGKNDYNKEEVIFSHKYVLHGHWHSLFLLDDYLLDHIRLNYNIVTCYRQETLVRKSLERITTRSDLFDTLLTNSGIEKQRWSIWKSHVVAGDKIETVQSTPQGFC